MAAITFEVGRRKASFSLGTPAAIGIGFNVSIREVGGEPYTGEYDVTPKVSTPVVLQTEGKTMKKDVTVLKIPQFEVSNPEGGKTLIIGDEYNG